VLISMSLALQEKGVIGSFTGWASGELAALHLQWPALFGALHLLFFTLHYAFASKTAHVGALYTAFLSLMLAGGGSRILGPIYRPHPSPKTRHRAREERPQRLGGGRRRRGARVHPPPPPPPRPARPRGPAHRAYYARQRRVAPAASP
jgi:hypothetical protein